MEGDRETVSRPRLVSWLAVILIGVPVLYFLSIGPVALVTFKCYPDGAGSKIRFLETVYAPIIWLDQYPVFRKPTEAYLRLWDVY